MGSGKAHLVGFRVASECFVFDLSPAPRPGGGVAGGCCGGTVPPASSAFTAGGVGWASQGRGDSSPAACDPGSATC